MHRDSENWNVYPLASVTMGALGLVGGRILILIPLLLSLMALVVGVAALRQLRPIHGRGIGMATAGLVLGLLGVAQALIHGISVAQDSMPV